MKKHLTTFLLAAIGLISTTGANAASYYYEETFDDPSHFPDEAVLPEGWKSEGDIPFQRYAASYIGTPANSGSYMFATLISMEYGRNEIFYTQMIPMKAGVDYKISFQLKMPGGTPSSVRNNNIIVGTGQSQEAEAQTTLFETGATAFADYTLQTGTFTPTEDGDYCFSFKLESNIGNSGMVFIDDVEIEGGEEPEDPEPPVVIHDTVDLPYFESFDDEENYDGKNVLPIGWLTTGTYPWQTASIPNVKAVTGTYYMVAPNSGQARNETAYTPFFDMTAGTEYTISFYLYMPGSVYDGEQHSNNFKFTVGTDQDSEFQTTTLIGKTNAIVSDWELQEVKFTPEKDGQYCFGFSLSTEYTNAGHVAVDDYLVTAPGMVIRPTADFSINSMFNLLDSKYVLFSGQTLDIVNQSKAATEYLWEMEGAEPSSSTDQNPSFSVSASGTYTIKLTAKNSAGERTTFKEVNISLFDTEIKQSNGLVPLTGYNPTEDQLINQGSVPTYDTDTEYDFVTGLNHYYRSFAERFVMPAENSIDLSQVSFFITEYDLSDDYGTLRGLPANFVVYGEKDGELDENNVIYRSNTTIEDILGTTGIFETQGRDFKLNEPVKISGNFYLAFELSPELPLVAPIAEKTRPNLALAPCVHRSGTTTFFVKADNAPEGNSEIEAGKWYSIDKFDRKLAGYGWYMMMWATAPKNGEVALNSMGEIVFAAKVQDNNLIVSGTNAGDKVAVYNMSGVQVASATATGSSTTLGIGDLAKGIYVVATPQGTQKVIK